MSKALEEERFIASITAFTESSHFCVAHTFTLKNVPSELAPPANAHPISPNASFIYLLLNWKTIQMSLAVMEIMMVDNQNAVDVLHW